MSGGFPSPIPLSTEVIQSLSKEQMGILCALNNLVKEEAKIEARRQSRIAYCSERVITVCEDEGLQKVREEIKQSLKEALGCGLGHIKLIQIMCKRHNIEP